MFLQRLAKINNTSDHHLKLVLDHHIKHFCAVKGHDITRKRICALLEKKKKTIVISPNLT